MTPRQLLVVDDIKEVREFLVDALTPRYKVVAAESANDALKRLETERFDVLVMDIAQPGLSGEALIAKVNESEHPPAIIAITAYGTVESASRMMKMGVYDYIEKPFAIDRITHTIEKAFEYRDLRRKYRILETRLRENDRVESLVGNSVLMQGVREKLRLVAASRATVLITGESGAGKDLVAREIHRLSDRHEKPFVKINFASIPEPLLERELFGHERGAVVLGKLELANAGSILLDEIGEMSATIQARLLRVIQEGEFDRVGGIEPVKVDVRIIVTTSRNLRKEIEKGNFREDLFYSLNVVPIEIPPLRERREDIPVMINHFIDAFASENDRKPLELSQAAINKLCQAYWRGNVRELKNVIERAVILLSGARVDEGYFQFDDDRDERYSQFEETFRHGSIRDMERLMIMHRLAENEQNRTRAAKTLEISVRTLRNKLREYRESSSTPEALTAARPV